MSTMTMQCSCGAQHEIEETMLGSAVPCGACGRLLETPQPVAVEADPPAAPEIPLPPVFPAVPDESVNPRLALPAVLPPALRSPERRLPAVSGTLGLLLGLVVSAGLAFVAPQGSMLGQVFNLSSPAAAIPTAIMCMLSWGGMVCLLRWQRLQALEQLSSPYAVREAAAFARTHGLDPLLDALQAPACQVSPLHKRLIAVVRQWVLRPSLQDADVVLRQHNQTEQDGIFAGYNLVRTFVWAMPVLGLIGTVIGIALAVGGFARFLGGSVDDVSTIKTSLVGVTSGLSFAFLITLEGLLGSLLLMLPSSALQAREERLQSATQQDFLDLILPALQEVAPEAPVASGGEGTLRVEWAEGLKDVTAETLGMVRAASTEVLQSLASWRSAEQRDLEQWATELRAQLHEGAGLIGEQITRAGHSLEASSGDFLARLQLFHETLQRDGAAQQELRAQLAREEAERQREIIAAMAGHHTSLNSAAGAIGQLVTVMGQVLAMQETLRQAVAEAGSSDLTAHVSQLMAAHSQTVRHAGEAAERLAATTRETIVCQQSLQDSMRQLHETNFGGTLGQFRDALVGLRPALEAFTQPGVWRWVVPEPPALPAGTPNQTN